MQKVRATFSSCLAVLIIGVLAGYAVMLLPQYAEGETISSSPTITIGSPAQQPVRIDANSSSEAITIRVNGVLVHITLQFLNLPVTRLNLGNRASTN